MKVLLNKEVAFFIKNQGSCIDVNGHKYFYMPYWYAETGEHECIFDVLSFDALPKELTDQIKKRRNEK